ncbi:receptor protein kinase-like protein [Trifolium medium]|uniref:Receptor protein kinase-like protein n=1 Tax=Trifolium medium TaxID=97028 RepID=A0A392MFM7_9FABA|nr:receptor protein kinase-like protein [Trifolium medium]
MNSVKYSFVSNFYGPEIWALFLLSWGVIVGTQSTTITSQQLQAEANAILNSGWWNTSDAHFTISNCCNWLDISCNDDGSITAIHFAHVFQYPREDSSIHFATLNLTAFRNLESLIVLGNRLRGTIPEEIGLLTKLTHLDLSGNSLLGEIPHSIRNLRRLEYLDISLNNIQGFIPSELGFLTKITTLSLSHNRLKALRHLF